MERTNTALNRINIYMNLVILGISSRPSSFRIEKNRHANSTAYKIAPINETFAVKR